MSEEPSDGTVPEWDLADRMRKALRESGLGVQEMADYLGVARTTVSNWINGHIVPSVQTLRLWALQCGVSYDWLLGDYSPHMRQRFTTNLVRIRKPGRTTHSRNQLETAA